MESYPDPVVRKCHSPSCRKSFLYVPSQMALDAGLADVVDRMATARERWVRVEDESEPGGRYYLCERDRP